MIDGTNLPAELRFTQFNEIPVLVIDHEIGQATISLQGAQLLSWKPKHQQEILWFSEIEPFTHWQCHSRWHSTLLSVVWQCEKAHSRHSSPAFMGIV